MIQKEAETYSVQIWRASDDRILKREWRDENGDLHNPDGPALEVWDEVTGKKKYEVHYICGDRHRLEAPALIEWDTKTGQRVAEIWWKDGKLHRDGDKPATTRLDPISGVIADTSYYVDGELHRPNGPATIERNADGSVAEVWMLHGKTHRDGGLPAIVKRDGAGEIVDASYWLDDFEITDSSYDAPNPDP